MTLSVLSGSTSRRHWIGLFAADAAVSRHLSYLMIRDGAVYEFTAPREPGSYEFRYVVEDERTTLAVSNRITVFGSAPSRPLVNLQVAATTVRAGAEIPASWFALSAGRTAKDWIGLYEAGAKNEDYKAWTYVADADQGQVTLKAPDRPGTYELRYLLDNGYESVATSLTIAVVP